MTNKDIFDSFEQMFEQKNAEDLVDFVKFYPHFTEQYISSLLKKLSILNLIISEVRKDE